MGAFFHTVIYNPIHSALTFLISVVPGGDVGIAIILITVLVKLILLPLALKASRTQHMMRSLEPELKIIKEEHKGNSEETARATLALYKSKNVNPFASILTLFIQIPVILGLYWVILAEKASGTFTFLGFIPLAEGSIIISVLVAGTQFYQAMLMMPAAPTPSGKSFQDDLAASMHLQMRYVLPIIIGVVSYVAGAAIALYFLTSNIFGIMQEVIAKRSHGN